MIILTGLSACINVDTPNVPRGTSDTVYVSKTDTVYKKQLKRGFLKENSTFRINFVDSMKSFVNEGYYLLADTFDFVQKNDTTDNYTFNDSLILIHKNGYWYLFHTSKGIIKQFHVK